MPELLKQNQSAFKEPVATPIPTPISATELQTPVTPFKVTPAAPATQSAGLEALIGTQNDAFTKDLEAKTKAAEATRANALTELQKGYAGSQGEVALTNKAYQTTVYPAEAELKDINQQIFAEQQATRREIENLKKNPQGLFGGALEQKIQEVQDKSLSRQADLSVIQLARQGKFDSAKAIADRAVAARLEQQRTKLEALKLNYEENKDLFTTAEKREFETKQADRERALNRQEADLKQISDLSLEALQSGAPTSIVAQMRQAKTPADAIRIGGGYVGLLDRQIKQAQLRKIQNENKAAENDLVNGVLTDAQIKAIDVSPQGKKVTSLGTLKQKLSDYQNLVKESGTSSFGAQKAKLNAAFADLKIAYKTAAELGALQGPDIVLLEEALRPATFANPLTQGFAKLTGNGYNAVVASLDQAQKVINTNAAANINQLFSRNPKYRESEYVNSLVDPLVKAVNNPDEIDAVEVGEVIKMADGTLLQKQIDGNFKEI